MNDQNQLCRFHSAKQTFFPDLLEDGPHSGPYVLLMIVFSFIFSGCGGSSAGTQTKVEPPAGFPVTMTDALDREVRFNFPPLRVISVAPKNTELIYALGFGERLVGVTTFCNYPAAALDLPKIGGVTSQTINQERIISLSPDLIVCSNLMHEELMSTWEELEIPVLVLGAETLDQMYAEMKMLAQLLGRPDAATSVITELQHRVKRVTDGVSQIPMEQRPKLFYQVWDEPLMGAGPSSFIGEILDLTGGINILNDVNDPYPYVSHEVVVDRNPDVVFAPTTHSQEVIPEKIAQQPGWETIEASRNNQIFLIDGDQVSRRGPRMIDALETMVGLMYPNHFPFPIQQGTSPKGESE